MHQFLQRHRHSRLQADDAERALLELLHLLAARMRRVVRRDRVHNARGDALDQRLGVRGAAQRRLHLVVAVVRQHLRVGQRQVMRRDLARHRQLARLGSHHHLERAPRRDMRHVEARPGRLGQNHVARHHDVFRGCGDAAQPQPHGLQPLVHVAACAQVQVLAVVDHGQVEGVSELHGPPHHPRVHHRLAVVGDRHHARRFHRSDGRQLLARAVLSDRADGKHVDDGRPLRAFDDVARYRGVVVHRVRVWHGADGGESARGRRLRAALDRFGVLEAGLAKVHVHVDEPRRYHQSRGIELYGAGGVQVRADPNDEPALDQHVGHFVPARGRVDHPSVLNQQFRHGNPVCVRAPPFGPQRRSRPGSGSPSAVNPPPPTKSRARG